MSHHIIEVQDLFFSYPDGTKALKGVSFRIVHGESVAIVGGNGAGKSTLLLHLNGCLLAQNGRILIGDVFVTCETAALARKAVGMVFQNPDDQLFMPTVAEDVAFGPLSAGLPKDQVERLVESALERVEMSYARERPPYRLSAGEKRAVAIATVLAMTPDILVMDEPSSYLDPQARRRLIGLLRSFEHTKIVATHDLELVVEACERSIVLDDGRAVADGPTREILSDEVLMRAHGLEKPSILRRI